jgi:fructose transport system permease protein
MPHLLSWTGTFVNVGPYQLTTGVLLMLALFAVTSYALSRTAWGRHVYAVGDDPEAARLSGIKTNRVQVRR